MNNIDKPLISIITVVLNGEKALEKSIESVISQKNDANIEYIIIDGGSSDGSVGIIKSYSDAIDYWISEPDTGIFNAWNKGIAAATGDYIAFLGADDFYYPGALKIYSDYIEKNSDFEYISSNVKYIGKRQRIIGSIFIWNQFRRHMTVAHVGSLHKRNLFARHGGYDESLRIVGDYEFLLRVGNTIKVGYINFTSAEMDGGGISTRLAYKAIKETFTVKKQHRCCSTPVALFDWIVAVSKVWLKNKVLR